MGQLCTHFFGLDFGCLGLRGFIPRGGIYSLGLGGYIRRDVLFKAGGGYTGWFCRLLPYLLCQLAGYQD